MSEETIQVPKAQWQALLSLAQTVELGAKMDCKVSELFVCGCRGPQNGAPACPCVMRDRAIKAALGKG